MKNRIRQYLNIGLALLLLSLSAQANVTYVHTDLLGTPIAESDAHANVLWREHYSPFGAKLDDSAAAKSNRVGYTGHQFDADTGLVYMQARYYDPVIGRFYSNDPVGFTGSVDTFNRYSYVGNNPYKYTDPTGMAKERGSSAGALVAVVMEALDLISPEMSQAMINSATGTKGSRRKAMTSLKKDAKIPRSQQSSKVAKVKMTDGNGKTVKNSDGKVVNTTEYTHTTTDGNKVVIQDHSAGHTKGNQGPHLNVRPAENTRTGKVEGTKSHYEFDKK